jgi:hypothetical protein
MSFETDDHVTTEPDGTLVSIARLDGRPFMKLVIPAGAMKLADQNSVPKEAEVDAVASFVEAAGELEREPFFGPDEKRTWSHSGENRWVFELGDRFHFRSALISFRRIWLKDEASNFERISGVLWRYCYSVEQRVQLCWAREICGNAKREKMHPPFVLEMSGSDVVDLWLNTVFAHGGTDRARRHQRKHFDEAVTKFGQGSLEYVFRNVVHELGTQYISVANRIGKLFLQHWESSFRMKPTFRIGSPFGLASRERTKEGHLIVRRASSAHSPNETFDQRLSRILERREFESLHRIIGFIDLQDENLVGLVLRSRDFEQFGQALRHEIRIVAEVDKDFQHYGKSFRASTHVGSLAKGFAPVYVYGDLLIVTNALGLRFLNEEFTELKRVLIEE